MLETDLPIVNDVEGKGVPAGLPAVMDAHVHIFPDPVFSAVWKWFDAHAWQIRYQMTTSKLLSFLLTRGITHIVALQYAHKPGMSRMLNQYMVEICRNFPGQVTGLATVFPGEDNAEGILQEAFDQGLKGVKLHAHVQCFDMNSDVMDPIYDCCHKNVKPMVMHIGREPNSPAYQCDPYALCSAAKLEAVLKAFPELKICVPHLGLDELLPYKELIEKYDTLWLDTTMAIADYFPVEDIPHLDCYRIDRIMYGSDFPNIPYAWDRELKVLEGMGLPPESLEKICMGNGRRFLGIDG